jgi:hypothetical protein
MAATRSTSLPRWKRDAVRRMRATRDSALAFVARLPEPEVVRPRTLDRWSVKDVLAHLLTCDEETVRRFRLIGRGQADRIHWFESMADADRFNARSVARLRRLGLRPLVRRMERARADLIDAFERLPNEALADPSHAYPVVEWLPAPGWDHVTEHLEEIKGWWRAQRPPRRKPSAVSRRGSRPRRAPP